MGEFSVASIVALLVLTLVTVLVASAYLYFLRVWFKAHSADVTVPLLTLFAMAARRASPAKIITAYANAANAGVPIPLEELEKLYMAKVNIKNIVDGMVAAKKQGKVLSFDQAKALVLQGEDVVAHVQLLG